MLLFQILAMTSDKYFAIKYPHKASVYSTPHRTRLIILTIFLLALGYNIPAFFLQGLDGDNCHGFAVKGIFTKVLVWISAFVSGVIPFTLLVYINFHIVQTVRKSRKQFHDKKNEIKDVVQRASKSEHDISSNRIDDPKDPRRKSKSAENQLTVMLVLVAILFLVLNAPTYVRFVYTSLFKAKTAREYASFFLFMQISQKLYLLNNCINFALYMGSGRKFRKELWEIIWCSRFRNISSAM